MKLRRLELKDKAYMLEWMHDIDLVGKLHADFKSKTIEDCESFIRSSWAADYEGLMHKTRQTEGCDSTCRYADCENLIQNAWGMDYDLHLAVADEKDFYRGTVSLKHIDRAAGTAEFAITMRRCALGSGEAVWAMRTILSIGWEKLHLKKIYWCVSKENVRAVRFYEKNGFQRTEHVPDQIALNYADCRDFVWYVWETEQQDME